MKGCRKVGEIDDKEIYVCEKEIEEMIEITISKWFKLADEFYDRLSKKYGEKVDLEDIVREMESFAEENNLDVTDIATISDILFGRDVSSVIIRKFKRRK